MTLKRLCLFLFPAFLFFFAGLPHARENQDRLGEIRRIQAMLAVSCDPALEEIQDLIEKGSRYHMQERRRLHSYAALVEKHRDLVAPFVLASDPVQGVDAGVFRKRFDALREQARSLQLLRKADFGDLPEGLSMAAAAATGGDPEGVGQAIFYYEDQPLEKGEAARIPGLGEGATQKDGIQYFEREMVLLEEDWGRARRKYLEDWSASEEVRETYRLLDALALEMTEEIRPTYEAVLKTLGERYDSGHYAHCLGWKTGIWRYQIKKDVGVLEALLPYSPGTPDTFWEIPGTGFRFPEPVKLPPIALAEIPEDFPLDLGLKRNGQAHLALGIEQQKLKAKAGREGVMAAGAYLASFVGLEGVADQAVGEAFNVFHGVVEGFASPVHLVQGIGTIFTMDFDELSHWVVGSTPWSDRPGPGETLIEIGGMTLSAIYETTHGAAMGMVNVLSGEPDDTISAENFKNWTVYADRAESAREAVTALEKFVGNALADLATGYILSSAKAARVAEDAAQTAADMSRATSRVSKLDDAARLRLAGKVEDIPTQTMVDDLGRKLAASQEDLKKAFSETLNPPPRTIPYSKEMLPDADDLLRRVGESTDRGGMNAYLRLNDDVGIKVGHKSQIKMSADTLDDAGRMKLAEMSSARDLDDAGRRFLQEATQDSSIARLPQIKERFYIVEDPVFGSRRFDSLADIPDGSRYRVADVMENIPPSSHAATLARNNQLTEGHLRAYEAFMRDLNNKGYIWPDNKLENFAFEAIDASAGRYRVVPMDTGGVYKLGDLPPGTDAGDLARKIQTAYSKAYEAPGMDTPINKIYAFLQEGGKQGIPMEILEDLDRFTGVQKINSSAFGHATTWGSGLRISSPNQPWASTYGQLAGQTDDAIREALEQATSASLAKNPAWVKAEQLYQEQKGLMAQFNGKMEEALRVLDDMATRQAAETLAESSGKSVINPLLAAAAQQLAVEVSKASELGLCLSVKQQVLAGKVADWLRDAWKKCIELGYAEALAQ